MNADKLLENGYSSSQASTPDTSFNDEIILVRNFRDRTAKKNKWFDVKNIPVAILSVSIFQVSVSIFRGFQNKHLIIIFLLPITF